MYKVDLKKQEEMKKRLHRSEDRRVGNEGTS